MNKMWPFKRQGSNHNSSNNNNNNHSRSQPNQRRNRFRSNRELPQSNDDAGSLPTSMMGSTSTSTSSSTFHRSISTNGQYSSPLPPSKAAGSTNYYARGDVGRPPMSMANHSSASAANNVREARRQQSDAKIEREISEAARRLGESIQKVVLDAKQVKQAKRRQSSGHAPNNWKDHEEDVKEEEEEKKVKAVSSQPNLKQLFQLAAMLCY